MYFGLFKIRFLAVELFLKSLFLNLCINEDIIHVWPNCSFKKLCDSLYRKRYILKVLQNMKEYVYLFIYLFFVRVDNSHTVKGEMCASPF